MIEASWVAGLGVILFGIGLIGAFSRKNAIVVLMCIEVMLNAANPVSYTHLTLPTIYSV